jgi:putative glutamine amidotransferase
VSAHHPRTGVGSVDVVAAFIAVPGRRTPEAKGLRTEAVAAGELYLDAVRRAGGEPAVVAPTDDPERVTATMSRFDGLLMLGGGDVDPARYGADVDPTIRGVDPRQDAFELMALRAAMELDLPVLAICRGLQLLNVACGGSLHQDIDGHKLLLHDVTIEPGSRLAGIGPLRSCGHSVHHQSIDRVGPGLVVTARADDGTVEGVELPERWVVGVQWHPEDTAADDPVQQALFDAFVGECARVRARSS